MAIPTVVGEEFLLGSYRGHNRSSLTTHSVFSSFVKDGFLLLLHETHANQKIRPY